MDDQTMDAIDDTFQEEAAAAAMDADICESIMSRYKNSLRDDQQHLCAVAGAIAQELKDNSLPSTPVSYFAASVSALRRLHQSQFTSVSDSSAADPAFVPLLIFLSFVVPRVPVPVVKSRGLEVLEVVVRVLEVNSGMQRAATAGLRCVVLLLERVEKDEWEKIEGAFKGVLCYCSDSRPKVRRQAHSCLRDILQSFQSSPVLHNASGTIANSFRRCLLFFDKSKSTDDAAAPDGTKKALEILYLLNALKDCLHLMSNKAASSIIKCFKDLLEIGQPMVTRNILHVLHTFSSSPTSDVEPAVLQEVLCSVVNADRESLEETILRSRVINVSMKKLYLLDRSLCVVKLPAMFSSLGDVLTCKHEEAIYVATDALKSLIDICIDESLIKQGVDQIKSASGDRARRSSPTIIEKICALLGGLISYQYADAWDKSFQVLSVLFYKLGDSSSYLMPETVKGLEDIEKLSDLESAVRKQLHKCVGAAVASMGPESFLRILPLMDTDSSKVNDWLFPILKQNIVGAYLRYFYQSILPLTISLKEKSERLEKDGNIVPARILQGHVYLLWSLLPSFCNYPLDTAESFGVLEKPLREALFSQPDLRGLICSSLQILIQQNKAALERRDDSLGESREMSIPEQRARIHYTPEVAASNLKILSAYSKIFLSDLFRIFESSPSDDGGWIQSTIGIVSSTAGAGIVRSYFKLVMKKLLQVTRDALNQGLKQQPDSMQISSASNNDEPGAARARLLDLASSLLPALDLEALNLLFIAIKPALQDEDGLVQKKAYKVLSLIVKDKEEFLASKIDEILELLTTVTGCCHFSAKRHRLDCLYFIIVHVSKDASEETKRNIISSYLTEIILALKESNKKTRNRAYDLLVRVGHAYGDTKTGAAGENILQFFNMVVGCLAGTTPHMISAAIKGIARLAYEFSDLVTAVSELLPSVLLLLQSKNREIVKADLGLMKVLVAKMNPESLQTHLKSMVEGLLLWKDDTKNHFKAKVKFLLEMLVRKCGVDAVRAVMPEEHLKLLTNIRKTKERQEKRRALDSEDGTRSMNSRASTTRMSRWNHTKIFSDVGDEDSDDETMKESTIAGRRRGAASSSKSTAKSLRVKQSNRSGKRLRDDLVGRSSKGDPLNLLDQQKTKFALRSSKSLSHRKESDDEPEFTEDGRLVITVDGNSKKRKLQEPGPDDVDGEADTRSRKSKRSMKSSSKTSAASDKRMKSSASGWAYTGSEYTSKKARGDLTKKDKVEPYAYWPLDRKMLNRREDSKAAARKGLESVTKLTKRLEGKSVSNALAAHGSRFKKQKSHKGKPGKRRK